MEKKVQEHDEKFKEVDLELESHREQLLQLKQNDEKFQQDVSLLKTDLAKLQSGQSSLELTVMKGNESTRDLITENKVITNRLLDHVIGKDAQDHQSDIDTRKQKWEIIGKISVAVASGSGVLYLIVQAYLP
ncbi:hypothetical protein [Peribacillus frigoritolerans]|uniref:hypothetical protein n=1 Tax=Peribacillus frigoritolerans TaxID=450367 RepID=UPI003015CAC1